MAAFLRKKFTQDSKHSSYLDSPQPSPSLQNGTPSQTPLFAKFATGGQFKSNGNPSVSPPLVSSPIPLARRKVDPEPPLSPTRRLSGAVASPGSRGEKEFDPRGNRKKVSKGTHGRPVDLAFSSKPLPTHPTPIRHQPTRSYTDVQPRQDSQLPFAPVPPLRSPGFDKPLPVVGTADPSLSSSPPPLLPTNGRTSADNKSPPYPPESEIPLPSARPEKPLPLPSPSPPLPQPSPSPSPSPPLLPRSVKGKERAVEPFPEEDDYPDPYQSEYTENPLLSSLPVNHGPSYLLNTPKVPYFVKSLPSEPETHSSPPTSDFFHSVPLTPPVPTTRQVASAPILTQSIPRPRPRPLPQPIPSIPTPPHSGRIAETDLSSGIPPQNSFRSNAANSEVIDGLPHAVGGYLDRDGKIDDLPPPDVSETKLDAPFLPNQSTLSTSGSYAPEPEQAYDDAASRFPDNHLSDSMTKEQPPIGLVEQSAWIALHADAFNTSDRHPHQSDNPSSFNGLLDQSTMGTTTNSFTHRLQSSPSKSTKARSSKARTSVSSSVVEEHGGHPSSNATQMFNQPQIHRKPSGARSANPHQRSAPVRGKPLIFAAMATVEQENEPVSPFMTPNPPTPHEFDAWANPPPTLPSPHTYSAVDGTTSNNNLGSTIEPWLPRTENDSRQNQSPHYPDSYSTDTRSSAEGPIQSGRRLLHHQPSKPSHPRKLSKSNLLVSPPSDLQSSHPPGGNTSTARNPLTDLHPRPSHRTLTKPRPNSQGSPEDVMRKLGPLTEPDHNNDVAPVSPLFDEDPFARTGGVKMLQPISRNDPSSNGLYHYTQPKSPSWDGGGRVPDSSDNNMPEEVTPVHKRTSATADDVAYQGYIMPNNYRNARSQRRGEMLEKAPPRAITDIVVKESNQPGPFPLVEFLSQPSLLASVLVYLTFYEWCVLSSVTKQIQAVFQENSDLREEILERYMATVGYGRWIWHEPEPLALSIKDLHDYMRGVSTPTYEYARAAEAYLKAVNCGPTDPPCELSVFETVEYLMASTRAYTRVVLRLRAQAESEHNSRDHSSPEYPPHSRASSAAKQNNYTPPPQSWSNVFEHGSTRAPSPAQSLYSQSFHGHSPVRNPSISTPHSGASTAAVSSSSSSSGKGFRSPLFRLRRAPLLRVFIPSPGGDWLSDASVLQCEAELKNAGVVGLMRMGDVVWDVAVGEEGNVGRMVWDGSYLIDLDYTFTSVGDLPKYLHALAFPPSYFHKVIRTGVAASNPIVHMDISPWGEEIAVNLQLLQDRVRTETPQGAYHNVVRWVHRSSFVIRPPTTSRGSNPLYTRAHPDTPPRVRIPGTTNLTVDPGWYGTVVVEAEGTNEGLADLQDRCGTGVFPPRAGGRVLVGGGGVKEAEAKKVFRILRERSRPGEIWIRTVREKERLI